MSSCGAPKLSSAYALPTFAASCYGSTRAPIAYQAGTCVGSPPFVIGQVPQPACCSQSWSMDSCHDSLVTMNVAKQSPSTWKI